MSFRREKGVPRGGPNGGNGGRGGDVVLVGRNALRTLRAFHFQKEYQASSGENGRTKDQFGKGGEALEIEVPCGTSVYRVGEDGNAVRVGDVLEDNQHLRIARGGRGGRGNAMFTSSTQQAPYIAEQGESGQEGHFRLEMRLIADVGIVGKPNAGKSTLLAAATAATPKIAPYPFTTTEPQLGMVAVGWGTFVLAEIPGLIEGAHLGIGLGSEFLRHATRTRLLIHLVDGSSEDAEGDLRAIDDELEAYGAGLDEKPQLIVINKVDMPEAAVEGVRLVKKLARGKRPVFLISAAARTGVRDLMETAARMLADLPIPVEEEGEKAVPVLAGRRTKAEAKVVKEGDVFVVLDEAASRLVGGSDLRVWAGRAQLMVRLERMGITQALDDAGVKTGDIVRFGKVELEW